MATVKRDKGNIRECKEDKISRYNEILKWKEWEIIGNKIRKI